VVVGLIEIRQRITGEVGEDGREAVRVILADPARIGDILEVVVTQVPVQTVLPREGALERLPGGIAGVPCMIVALNDNFVVPIPASLKITGFFKAAGNTMISADARDDVARGDLAARLL
jgi:hypothetical protein